MKHQRSSPQTTTRRQSVATTTRPDHEHWRAARAAGWQHICGIDEVGRGPLAGPVMAAAVLIDESFSLPGIHDSKKLRPKQREQLAQQLREDPRVRWHVAAVSSEEIDSLNILRATHLAMERAVQGLVAQLDHEVDFCLIDGLPVPRFPYPHRAVVKGDALSLSIACASVIAKVTRDHWMAQQALAHPQYGFERHSGYGTPQHLAALRAHGPCVLHRRSFAPVANAIKTS